MSLFFYFSICETYCTLSLDTMVWEYLTAVRDSRVKEREKLVKLQKMWALRKPVLDAHILLLSKKIQEWTLEIDEIMVAKLNIQSAHKHISFTILHKYS